MGRIIEFRKPDKNTNDQINECQNIERLLNLCADSNECCDFHDYLSSLSQQDEFLEEELELVAGGKADIWKLFIDSI